MVLDIIRNNEDKFYVGDNVTLDGNVDTVFTDNVKINNNGILFTECLHFCICILVVGKKESGMAHIGALEDFDLKQQELINDLMNIEDIENITVFLGPKTPLEIVNKLKKYIKSFDCYISYIDNPLGFENSTGSIAYDIASKKFYGYNNDGFTEYKEGFINVRKDSEIIKMM